MHLATSDRIWEKCTDCRKIVPFPGARNQRETIGWLKRVKSDSYLYDDEAMLDNATKAREEVSHGDTGLQ